MSARTAKEWDALIEKANVTTVEVKVSKVSGMVRYSVTSESQDALEVWSLDLLERYHPMGYNTDISTPVYKPNIGRWCLYASRYISAGG